MAPHSHARHITAGCGNARLRNVRATPASSEESSSMLVVQQHTHETPHDICHARRPLTAISCFEEGTHIKSDDVRLLGVGTCHLDGILHHF